MKKLVLLSIIGLTVVIATAFYKPDSKLSAAQAALDSGPTATSSHQA